ncbi:TetR/AcrR family transcriptional regulator [Rhodoligotrophos defluvii]|uniref:TetR/AcrR family transcriptional regulator n=1 Tax=Rhodoligotrophos defluvii TaxID=2561934 RepID=UPI0010C94676|nr:TetR/AcrR family transcriptional regulator [Rhodoligotrophos defluvii]
MSKLPKKTGRPRAYDPDQALQQARCVFWDGGFSSTSLDDISAATSMNRPSLYGAFGDKEALYLKTLERYRDESLGALRDALSPDRPLKEGLHLVYSRSLDTYLAGERSARGCFLIGTATVEAVNHPEIRAILSGSLDAFEGVIENRLQIAVERGELERQTDTVALSRFLSVVMHSLAVRARAGQSREVLDDIARSAVDLVCGSKTRAETR